ncbi:uncharacterized protein MONOS_15139 [Monocercomonoides exilis]|uniref:uncharacterized protein n=1 Tax=Monocercomonoides exilis TaxID=2049356 RepID=UPI00355A68DB|nr:hypothetical protein MONOS_15139 [Monocercomonoides exilis]|eukprot:MONOS_15139.1-p1 / transcript=MONOS_15139.1 / gene=MONOS_15139 / organism=Monocercomonoides_exilis_PA203 / gene_product=unspecified product / transcript_product=unspecified product / location=Mono_scaffold01153:9869-10255(-) / protein_length=129 / sequence_SO=supercontig / SO=protein_coding / is_pseudo=false
MTRRKNSLKDLDAELEDTRLREVRIVSVKRVIPKKGNESRKIVKGKEKTNKRSKANSSETKIKKVGRKSSSNAKAGKKTQIKGTKSKSRGRKGVHSKPEVKPVNPPRKSKDRKSIKKSDNSKECPIEL